MEFSCSHCGQL